MEENYSIKSIIIILVILLGVILAFYGLTILLVDKDKDEEKVERPTVDAVIQYEEIVVGAIFKQKEDAYYVLALTSKDEHSSTYMANLNSYVATGSGLKAYTINLDNAFNSKYLKEESDFSASLPEFKTSTLLKIENKKIVESYEGDDITIQLGQITN